MNEGSQSTENVQQGSSAGCSPVCKKPRLSLPDLTGLSSQTDDDIKQLFVTNQNEFCSYLSYVTNGSYEFKGVESIMFSCSKIKSLVQKWSNVQGISIEGPKGCGKTFLCAMLYQMVADDVNHLFLSPNSFALHTYYCQTYFKYFFNSHLEDFKQDMSIDIGYCSRKIVEIADKTNLTVFLDLSSHSKQEQKYLLPFLEVITQLISCKNVRVLLSISSGFRTVRRSNMNLNHLVTLLQEFEVFYSNGFTYDEAQLFYTNTKLSFEQVFPLTGTCPLLLKVVQKCNDLGTAKQRVQTEVENYMSGTLHLDMDSSTLEDYFLKHNLVITIDLAYCACWNGRLSNEDELKLKTTFLAAHHLTVVEEVERDVVTISDDKNVDTNEATPCVDTNEATPCVNTGAKKQKEKRLRWNFPTLGVKYIDVLENFLQKSSTEKLNEVCRKEPSFAGFWFENMFISHYKDTQASLIFDCVKRKAYSTATTEIEFKNFTVRRLGDVTEMENDVLYELKRAHPIIDCIGNLTDTNHVQWLVFIQISLQRYVKHKPLDLMFRSNSGNDENKSWSLYTKYRQRYKIQFTDHTKKILLAYISPNENELEQLKDDVQNRVINQDVYVGVLSDQASFYHKMIDFNKSRLRTS